MSALSRPVGLLWLVAGFLVWSSAFLALYGLHAVGCAYGWGEGTLRTALLAVWGAHVVLAGALIPLARRAGRGRAAEDDAQGARFVAQAAIVLSAAAFVAAIWIGLPVLAYPLCR